ncbi:hypothetical protein P8C59_001382 [Phyllachora maydis]|uniref:Uncharacterized protein n=1 Tax=Phyllachora maydis TaxID=1825666 RepID=A0AAD9MBB6_9PEZI|nr:hypothetical protein P8C59_001382 [Phyllachora maydis]
MQKMASLAALSQLQFPRARANKALRPGNPAPPTANDNNNNPLSQPLSTDHLNGNTEMKDRQTTTTTIAPTTAKETAIGAITTAPTAPSSSAPPTINTPTISAPPLTNVFAPFLRGLNGIAVKGLTVYDRVIEEGLLEEAKKQYPTARQPRRPIRRGSSRATEP